MKRYVLACQPNFETACKTAIEKLQENGFEIDFNPYGRSFSRSEIMSIIGRYDAIISEKEPLDGLTIANADRLKIISRFGTGLDNVDLSAAREKGICVSNAAGGNASSVANMTVGLILAVKRKIALLDRCMRNGIWRTDTCDDIDGSTVGLIGFGRNAFETVRCLSGFRVKFLAFNRSGLKPVPAGTDVLFTDMDTVLKESDIISIHLPLTDSTYHMIDEEKLALVKPTSILINSSRGGIIDTGALYEALSHGKIAGAGLDVFEEEPLPTEERLLGLDNVVLTPHVAGNTNTANRIIGEEIADDLISFFSGKPLKHRVI